MRPAATPLVLGTMPLYHALWSSLMALSLGLQAIEERAGVPELMARAAAALALPATQGDADWMRAYV